MKTGTEYQAPAGEIEKTLAEVWQEVLGVERIGTNDNFFELGGHSLKATILAAKIHQACNVEVPLREIFQKPTIRELARYIAQAREDIYAAIEPARNGNTIRSPRPRNGCYYSANLKKAPPPTICRGYLWSKGNWISLPWKEHFKS